MIRILCLLYPDFHLLDIAGPMSVFEVTRLLGYEGYEVKAAATSLKPVQAMGGLSLVPHASIRGARFDTLFIPGGLGAREPDNYRDLLPLVKRAGREGRRIISISSGAFILAKAGLLEGRHAVTHFGAAPLLADLYPKIEVDGVALFSEQMNIWTSAGSVAGVDLALAIVERDYGAEAAARVAAALLLPYRRTASQNQQSPLLKAERPVDRFDEVMAWARERLDEDLSIERLADHASLSVRHFTRAFRLSTGLSPAKFVEQLRTERARGLIESSARSLEEVAEQCGFGSAERMRLAFVRILGRTPREMRRAARAEGRRKSV